MGSELSSRYRMTGSCIVRLYLKDYGTLHPQLTSVFRHDTQCAAAGSVCPRAEIIPGQTTQLRRGMAISETLWSGEGKKPGNHVPGICQEEGLLGLNKSRITVTIMALS